MNSRWRRVATLATARNLPTQHHTNNQHHNQQGSQAEPEKRVFGFVCGRGFHVVILTELQRAVGRVQVLGSDPPTQHSVDHEDSEKELDRCRNVHKKLSSAQAGKAHDHLTVSCTYQRGILVTLGLWEQQITCQQNTGHRLLSMELLISAVPRGFVDSRHAVSTQNSWIRSTAMVDLSAC